MYYFMEAKNNKERYVAPMMDVVELQPTGILCASPFSAPGGLNDPNDYEDGGSYEF